MVIGLFYKVAHWTEYFHAMVYLNDFEKVPPQVLLREFAINSEKRLNGRPSKYDRLDKCRAI